MAKNYPEWITTKSQQRMHDDFKAFLWFMWRELKLPSPTPVQYAIADYLQHGPRRRIIQAFRGVGKSWITAAFVLWLLWRDPNHRIMVVSASKERADAFSIFVKTLIGQIEMLAFLKAKVGQRDSNVAFDVGPAGPDQAPSVRSVGITGQLTGGRANTIIADDVEVPKNSATETMREKLSELVKEFDAVLKPNGQIVYLGTPQIAQSLYSRHRLQKRGYACRIWPARYTTGVNNEGDDKYNGALASEIVAALVADRTLLNRTTEPSRFTDIDLMEREASYGRSGFALQFMLDTSLNDEFKYPLRLRDLIVMAVHRDKAPVQLVWASGPEQLIPELDNVGLDGDRYYRPMYIAEDWREYQGSVMFIDPSGRGNDETAYCVTKMLNGMVFITRWGGLRDGHSDTTLRTLAEIAKAEGVNEIQVEANFGDGMWLKLFAPVLKDIHRCTLDEYKVSGQKEVRIINKLEPALNQHRVVITPEVIEADLQMHGDDSLQYSGLYQLTHITKDRGSLSHDDRLDVLAEAVGYWAEQVSRDTKKAEMEHKAKLVDAALKDHQRACKVMAGRGSSRRVSKGVSRSSSLMKHLH